MRKAQLWDEIFRIALSFVIILAIVGGIGSASPPSGGNSLNELQSPSIADSWQLPLDGGTWLNQSYFSFGLWVAHYSAYHVGEDVWRAKGTPVRAAANGIVKDSHLSNSDPQMGCVVVIEHELPDGSYVCSVYWHLNETGLILPNVDVVKGDLIGFVADKETYPNVSTPHLHFGIRKGNYSTDADPDSTPTVPKWRYRGYAPKEIVDLWYSPYHFIKKDILVIDERTPFFEKKQGSFWEETYVGYNNHTFWTYANNTPNPDYWGRWNVSSISNYREGRFNAGQYEVFAFIPSNGANSNQAKYEIRHNGKLNYSTINQSPLRDVWISLGTYDFSSSGDQYIRLNDNTGEDRSLMRMVGYDAIKLVYLTTPQTGTIIVTSSPGNASVYLDNIYKGSTTATTSLQISGVSVGQHWVKVTKPKYIDYYEYVIVTAGGTHNVNATLSIGSDDYKFVTHWGHSGSGNGQLYIPASVAVDSLGNVYVADAGNSRIQKFSSTGIFLAKWGSVGDGDGQFYSLSDLAVDSSGNVYVADYDRIQKFNSTGTFLAKWGSYGEEDGQFKHPEGVAVDLSGNVYVVDYGNSRIQKFSSNGTFLGKWGAEGTEDGQFEGPSGIAVDSSGNVYVADINNNRIQKFNSTGTFLAKWGSEGEENGQFVYPYGVAVDLSGNVYVVDYGSSRIQKFNSTGTFLAKWGAEGTGNGEFISTSDVAVDSLGNVYIADGISDRIQKFNSTGKFLAKWGSDVSLNGQLCSPEGVAVDSSGNVFVADRCNDRIQKFSSGGTFLAKWGAEGTEDGQFEDPSGVAVDSSGNVYVADEVNTDELYRIQKFSSTGTFLAKWGTNVSGYEQFDSPHGVAVDSSGKVYIADTWGDAIWKFSSNGTLVGVLGSYGTGDGRFSSPTGVAVDSTKNVYVADTYNDRIQKFSSNGTFLAKWGSYGEEDGQFKHPEGVAVDSWGNVYVADTDNRRIQKFSSNGTILAKWGQGEELWINFGHPSGVAVDSSGNIYVADTGNRIWKLSRSFSPTGIGVFRPSIHTFYLKNGTTTTAINWGVSTDLPVTGDWNGDGRTEVGVFRNSTHMFYLKNGTTTTAISWGLSNDLPVTGKW